MKTLSLVLLFLVCTFLIPFSSASSFGWNGGITIDPPKVSIGNGSTTNIYHNATNFTELLDTPNSYSGEGGNCVKVNVGETGLVFDTCSASVETDPIFILANSTLARTGNCPAGQVVQNTTNSGVQCTTVASTGGNLSWNESRANELYININGDQTDNAIIQINTTYSNPALGPVLNVGSLTLKNINNTGGASVTASNDLGIGTSIFSFGTETIFKNISGIASFGTDLTLLVSTYNKDIKMLVINSSGEVDDIFTVRGIDGSALLKGDLYLDDTNKRIRIYEGSMQLLNIDELPNGSIAFRMDARDSAGNNISLFGLQNGLNGSASYVRNSFSIMGDRNLSTEQKGNATFRSLTKSMWALKGIMPFAEYDSTLYGSDLAVEHYIESQGIIVHDDIGNGNSLFGGLFRVIGRTNDDIDLYNSKIHISQSEIIEVGQDAGVNITRLNAKFDLLSLSPMVNQNTNLWTVAVDGLCPVVSGSVACGIADSNCVSGKICVLNSTFSTLQINSTKLEFYLNTVNMGSGGRLNVTIANSTTETSLYSLVGSDITDTKITANIPAGYWNKSSVTLRFYFTTTHPIRGEVGIDEVKVYGTLTDSSNQNVTVENGYIEFGDEACNIEKTTDENLTQTLDINCQKVCVNGNCNLTGSSGTGVTDHALLTNLEFSNSGHTFLLGGKIIDIGSHNLTTTGQINATIYYGNGSQLTSLPATGSYNLTYATTTNEWNGNKSALIGSVNNASYLSTYNSTYAGSINNASYLSTYNETYNGAINNASYLSTYNVTYAGLINNASYLSTYNLTYANTTNITNNLVGKFCASTDKVSGVYVNGSINCSTDLNSGGGSSFNATYDNATNRLNNLTGKFCSGTDKMNGVHQNGSINCTVDATGGAGGGNPFNQVLNTTSNVTFNNITVNTNSVFIENVSLKGILSSSAVLPIIDIYNKINLLPNYVTPPVDGGVALMGFNPTSRMQYSGIGSSAFFMSSSGTYDVSSLIFVFNLFSASPQIWRNANGFGGVYEAIIIFNSQPLFYSNTTNVPPHSAKTLYSQLGFQALNSKNVGTITGDIASIHSADGFTVSGTNATMGISDYFGFLFSPYLSSESGTNLSIKKIAGIEIRDMQATTGGNIRINTSVGVLIKDLSDTFINHTRAIILEGDGIDSSVNFGSYDSASIFQTIGQKTNLTINATQTYFTGGISVSSIEDRTEVWDSAKDGSALEKIYTADELVDDKGVIDHLKMAGGYCDNRTDYSRPVLVNGMVEECTTYKNQTLIDLLLTSKAMSMDLIESSGMGEYEVCKMVEGLVTTYPFNYTYCAYSLTEQVAKHEEALALIYTQEIAGLKEQVNAQQIQINLQEDQIKALTERLNKLDGGNIE